MSTAPLNSIPDLPPKFWMVDDNDWKLAEGGIRRYIEPGLYQLIVRRSMGSMEVLLRAMHPKTDRLLPLAGSLSEYIMCQVESFWNSSDRYEAMGIVHKRGLLMQGAPGCGKTAICIMVGQEVARRGGISILTMPSTHINPLPEVLESIREAQPDTPIINIIEDIDQQREAIDVLLPMLDGETQINNVLHIASTNYIEKLDSRLTNRPSRFDEVIVVRPPIKLARETYLRMLLKKAKGVTEEQINGLVRAGKGLMFAHLKELATASYVHGHDPDKTATRLRALAQLNSKAGFERDDEEEE